MEKVKKSELIFLYDLAWANPNGDPNDANKPRIDEETSKNIVTDVRLKRTIRDELYANGCEILVRDTYNEDGTLKDGKNRAKDFLEDGINIAKMNDAEKNILKENVKKCIDVRLFGCTLPYENGSVIYTGPVQFKMGYSLNEVKCEYIKGTGAFASGEGSEQKTFRQEYVLPYSLINFYGMINSRSAVETNLTEEDINKMLKSMWSGTQNLITRTKVGQQPRLLIRVAYKDEDYYIGSLDKYIKYECENSFEVRNINDGKLIFNDIKDVLLKNKDAIEFVYIRMDAQINCDINIIDELKKGGINVVENC
ncbi:MAG: type I-B CRISPR-associated protein Cas7/Csh2 [Bacilli bacterium]